MQLEAPNLVYVTPHSVAAGIGAFPTRPTALLSALQSTGAFRTVTVVHRVRPWHLLSIPGSRGVQSVRGLGAVTWKLGPGVQAIVHAAPFGVLETLVLDRLIRAVPEPRVVWVADPKSAVVFARLAGHRSACDRYVFDAYDAWDLSPLVRGVWRRRAVLRGYQAAAAYADLIFANTHTMQNRMVALGAKAVHLLPNAAPGVSPRQAIEPPYLAYLGNIHERFDATLVDAVAAAFSDVTIRIAGPVERVPRGLAVLLRHPNVRLEGPQLGEAATAFVGGARALIVPHVVNDYTRSQDVMKAWDAIALGTPVVSTSIPPVDAWPKGVGLAADGARAFVAAVGRVLAGELDSSRAERLAFAAENLWHRRAHEVLSTLEAARSGV
jgi:teichuronic acid biosynthesis glycosyltransferase TuaH